MSSKAFADREKVINTYCWITSTFTFPDRRGELGTHFIAPGVSGHDPDGNNEPVYHSYYQWVPFVLFLQVPLAITFTGSKV